MLLLVARSLNQNAKGYELQRDTALMRIKEKSTKHYEILERGYYVQVKITIGVTVSLI
jgi:hypothetical protein